MTKHRNYTSIAAIIILSAAYLFIFYGKVLVSPNSYCFGGGGDGIKNYYTFAYSLTDNSDTNLSGMNYPYGESFLYTDSHPIICLLFKPFVKVFPELPAYAIGVLNFCMLLSIFLTPILLFLIFTRLRVTKYFAVLSAIGIAMLAPQIQRLGGHYALSYSCAIPLSWYLLILYYEENKKWTHSLLILLNNLFWLLIHAYLGMMIICFMFFFWCVDYLFKHKLTLKLPGRTAMMFLIQVIAPILTFIVYANITDIHDGRTNNPWGFLIEMAHPYNILFPNMSTFKDKLDKLLHFSSNQPWEGNAYIGMISNLVLLIILITLIKTFRKNKLLSGIYNSYPNILVVSFISSFIVLLLALSIPFRYDMKFMADWFPVIKQFRALGRFSWIFFFVMTTFSVWMFDVIARYYYNAHRRKWIAYLVWIIVPVIYVSEGIAQHKYMSASITQTPNFFLASNLDTATQQVLHKIDRNKFQAIFPLPYYHKGSDNYVIHEKEKIWKASALLSFHKHIPICGAYLTRVSIWESKNCIQLISPDYYPKAIAKDIPKDKPFLLVYSNEPITWYEQRILEKATPITQTENFSLYELWPDSLFTSTAAREITALSNLKEKLYPKNGFVVTDSTAFLYYDDFDASASSLTFRGKGAKSGNKREHITLCHLPTHSLQPGVQYLASFWMYNCGKNYGQDMLSSLAVVCEGDKWISCQGTDKAQIINGCWSFVEIPFTISNPSEKVSVFVKGDDRSKLTSYFDDILIRQAGVDVYKILEEKNGSIKALFKNNQQIEVR